MKGGAAYGRGEPAPYTGSLIIGFLQEGYGPEVVNVRKKDFAGSEGEGFMGKSGGMEEEWKSKREGRGFSASLKKASIRRQLYTIYILAVILPIALIGGFLLWNTDRLLTDYHRDLLESDNSRVRNILFEITAQVYNMSENIAFDEEIQEVLRGNYYMRKDMPEKVDRIEALDNYNFNYAEVESIEIYVDNPTLTDYKQFHYADRGLQGEAWYQRALGQSSVFWVSLMNEDAYGNEYWALCLVRKIPVMYSNYHAALVIRLSDNYLHTRIGSRQYETTMSVDRDPVFFSTDRDAYGLAQEAPVHYGESYYQYTGNMTAGGEKCIVNVSTLPMYQSDSNVYICTVNRQAYDNIRRIIGICMIIIAVAVLVPGILIHFFTSYFTSRILTLRYAMHRVSNEDYEIDVTVSGQDEVSEAFADLEVMVKRIEQKDAQMYEARIKEKELVNKQQEMEFKMLASQINPHFLYNTLETIRMKAFTAGDREAARAIKLLGKSLRYVLDNTGTKLTALDKELEHVENYLAIQKLRFGEKFDSFIDIGEGVETKELFILPLILQPIVENALLHGLEETESGGEIRLSLYQKEGFFFIDVTDNGCGMTAEALEELRRNIDVKDMGRSKSIGLYNINQRLNLYYGGSRNLRIYSEYGKGTTVRLTFFADKGLPQKD